MSNHNEISSFIWNVCDDVLRGLFRQQELRLGLTVKIKGKPLLFSSI
jgi:hypothetical protein